MKPDGWGCFRRMAATAAWLLATMLAPTGPARAADDDVLRLEVADFIQSDSTTAPPDSAPWQPVTLPDRWDLRRFGARGFAWYRLRFQLEQVPKRQQAIFFPALMNVGTVYLNGTWIGQ